MGPHGDCYQYTMTAKSIISDQNLHGICPKRMTSGKPVGRIEHQKEISIPTYSNHPFSGAFAVSFREFMYKIQTRKKNGDSLPYQQVQDFSHRQYQPPFLTAIKIPVILELWPLDFTRKFPLFWYIFQPPLRFQDTMLMIHAWNGTQNNMRLVFLKHVLYTAQIICLKT